MMDIKILEVIRFIGTLTPIKILEVIRFIGTLTPKNDQDRISPYNIDTITRQVMKMKQNFNLGNIS